MTTTVVSVERFIKAPATSIFAAVPDTAHRRTGQLVVKHR